MKIKKTNNYSYFPFYPISSGKTENYYWGTCPQNLFFEFMPQLIKNHIIIFDDRISRSSQMSLKFRKYLNLNKKDNDYEIYLIVIPFKKYFKNNFIKKCFFKSKNLINKKYFFIDHKTYKLFFSTGIFQKIFYLKGN